MTNSTSLVASRCAPNLGWATYSYPSSSMAIPLVCVKWLRSRFHSHTGGIAA